MTHQQSNVKAANWRKEIKNLLGDVGFALAVLLILFQTIAAQAAPATDVICLSSLEQVSDSEKPNSLECPECERCDICISCAPQMVADSAKSGGDLIPLVLVSKITVADTSPFPISQLHIQGGRSPPISGDLIHMHISKVELGFVKAQVEVQNMGAFPWVI